MHQPAIGQGQRLLGNNALIALITLFGSRPVERRQEHISFIVGMKKVQTAAEGGVLLGRQHGRPSHGEVE